MKEMDEKSKKIQSTALGIALFCAGVIFGIAIVHTKNSMEYDVNTIKMIANADGYKNDPMNPDLIEINTESILETARIGNTETLDTVQQSLENSTGTHEQIVDDDQGDYSTESYKTELGYLVTASGELVPIVPTSPYFVSPKGQKLNWFQAFGACNRMSKELVSITSEKESERIEFLIHDTLEAEAEILDTEAGETENDFWTAGINLWGSNFDEFYWATSGQQIKNFSNWHTGTPNFPQEQHCIEITKDIDSMTAGNYKWNDYGCHIPARYICQ